MSDFILNLNGHNWTNQGLKFKSITYISYTKKRKKKELGKKN